MPTSESARDELRRLYPLVRYVIPPALVLVTGAKAVGVARPAWRLALGGARDELLVLVATAVALAALGAAGWLLRAWLPYPRRRGRRRG